MDILSILKESGTSLYPEDLDFFETELATGEGYDAAYQQQCRSLIKTIRAWQTKTPEKPKTLAPAKSGESGIPAGLQVSVFDLTPKDQQTAGLSATEIIFREIKQLRQSDAYKTKFKKYVAGKQEIDEKFVDSHYAFFQPWELDAIISVKQMPEEFLEKYFGALDHDKLGRYQKFSEHFFMKHYSQMNPEIVLKYGKNDWRKKENRSKQLDVFLRLKGIQY